MTNFMPNYFSVGTSALGGTCCEVLVSLHWVDTKLASRQVLINALLRFSEVR